MWVFCSGLIWFRFHGVVCLLSLGFSSGCSCLGFLLSLFFDSLLESRIQKQTNKQTWKGQQCSAARRKASRCVTLL